MEYELVREIKNLCRNNQMRDISFEEVETEDPVEYVRRLLRGRVVEITPDWHDDGSVSVHACVDGLIQTFTFTPL